MDGEKAKTRGDRFKADAASVMLVHPLTHPPSSDAFDRLREARPSVVVQARNEEVSNARLKRATAAFTTELRPFIAPQPTKGGKSTQRTGSVMH